MTALHLRSIRSRPGADLSKFAAFADAVLSGHHVEWLRQELLDGVWTIWADPPEPRRKVRYDPPDSPPPW